MPSCKSREIRLRSDSTACARRLRSRKTLSSGGPDWRTICSSQRRSASKKRRRGDLPGRVVAVDAESRRWRRRYGGGGRIRWAGGRGGQRIEARSGRRADRPPRSWRRTRRRPPIPPGSAGGGGTLRTRLPVRRSQPKPSPPPFLNSQHRETSRESIKKVSERAEGKDLGPARLAIRR